MRFGGIFVPLKACGQITIGRWNFPRNGVRMLMHEVSMILIIYDVQLGILGLKQVFFSDHYMAVLSWSVWKLAKVPSFCCYILQTFEADFLHSASQPYHMPYIIPVHIYRLTTRNHVSYSVLLSHVPFSHAGILGLGIFSYYWSGLPSIQRDLTGQFASNLQSLVRITDCALTVYCFWGWTD